MTAVNGEGGAAEGGGGRSGVGVELHGSSPSYAEPASGLSAVKLPPPKPFAKDDVVDV